MYFKKYVMLLFLTSAFGQDDKNMFILHFGENDDSVANDYIEKAVNFVNSQPQMGYELHLTKYRDGFEQGVEKVCNSIAEYNNESLVQHIIIDTTKKAKHRDIASTISINYGVPVIYVESLMSNLSDEKTSTNRNYYLRFSPPNLQMHDVIEAIAIHTNMTDFAVVYNKNEEYRWDELRAQFHSRGILCVFVACTENNFAINMAGILKMKFKNIFRVGKLPAYDGFTGGQVVYDIISGMQDPNEPKSTFTKVTAIPYILNQAMFKDVIGDQERALEAAFYYDLTLMGILALRKLMSLPNLVSDNCAVMRTTFPPEFREKINEMKAPMFGPIHHDEGERNFMEIRMDLMNNQRILVEDVANSFKIINEEWKTIKPRQHYKVLARVKPPFVYSSQDSSDYFGYSIDMLNMIASILDFTYDLTVLQTGPDFHADTSHNFVQTTLSGNYDIGLGPLYESFQYSPNVSFSIPYYKMVGIKFVLRNSKDDSIFTFITVMEPVVWGCILSAFFINSFLLWASERFSPYSYRNNKEKYANDEEQRDFTAKECVWFCLTSITPDGGGIVPKHISARLIVVTWWLFGFIILASYTANLAAFLTLSKMKNPIENFDDLYRQFRMRYLPLNNTDEMDYFQKMISAEEDHRKLTFKGTEYPLPNRFNRMDTIFKSTTKPTDIDSALKMVYDSPSPTEGFAFIVDAIDARYLLMTRCKLIDVEEEVGKRNLVISTNGINTILKHDIDRALTIIQQNQWDTELDKKWWDNNPFKATNCTVLEDESDGIGIYNMGGVFLINFIGIGIAMLTMIYDYLRYKHRIKAKVIPLSRAATATIPTVAETDIPKKKEDDLDSTKLQRRNVNRF